MHTFSPNTKAQSQKVNENFTDLSTGAGDQDVNKLSLLRQETEVDFVVTGLSWSLVSGLNGAMTAGVAYVSNGTSRTRIAISAILSRAFTASKDTYIDIDSSGTLYYTEVANGATSGMTLASNRMRIAKVVTNGSTITGVTQVSTDPLGQIIYNQSPIRVLRDEGWQTVTFQSGWGNLGNPWGKASYRKDSMGIVWLKGCISGGTVGVGTPFFTLPVGYRPATNEQVRFPVISNNALGVVNVYANGQVNLEVGSNAYVFLDSIRFRAEQ